MDAARGSPATRLHLPTSILNQIRFRCLLLVLLLLLLRGATHLVFHERVTATLDHPCASHFDGLRRAVYSLVPIAHDKLWLANTASLILRLANRVHPALMVVLIRHLIIGLAFRFLFQVEERASNDWLQG